MNEHLSAKEIEYLEETRKKSLSTLRLINYVANLLKSNKKAEREKGKFLHEYLGSHGWRLEDF